MPRVPRRAAVLAVALALVGIGAVAAPGSAVAAGRSGQGPLTFDEAKAQGTKVDWGPNCDTTTGRVAVPSGYAPPCVAPWKGGDNGGATAPGVTKDTITVALYQTQPDLLQQTFFENSGSDESLAKERDTTQEYVDYFSAHYELYGRKIELVTVKASGAPDDDVAAKADAIKVATEVKAFASFGGPGQTSAYAEELAARGVLCVGDCLIAQPQQFLEQHSPYVWPTLASPEQASEHWAAFVGTQLAEGKAVHAGSKELAAKKRVFGVVHYDDDAGTFRRSVSHFEDLLGTYHVKPAVTVPYTLDLGTAQEDARLVITKLKTAGVTSVLLAGDPVFPTFLTKEATAQGFFPEWVVLGYAFTDTAVFGRQYDQKQWAHAFGVSLLPARTADDVDELGNLITWQTGQPPSAKTFRELVQAPLIFFTGVHLAGPEAHGEVVPRRALPLPVGHRHHADATAPFVGTARHLEGHRPHRQRRRHRDVVGPERDRARRGRPRREGAVPVRRRAAGGTSRGLADEARRALRRRDLRDRAHAATARRRPPTTPRPLIRRSAAEPGYPAAYVRSWRATRFAPLTSSPLTCRTAVASERDIRQE